MEYRLAFKLDCAAETEVLAARALVKRTLEPIYGHISTITVEEWLFQEHAKPAQPFGYPPRPDYAEHGNGRSRADSHRRRI